MKRTDARRLLGTVGSIVSGFFDVLGNSLYCKSEKLRQTPSYFQLCFQIYRRFSTTVNDSYDVAVIGGGPGGYVAAIKCAQFGLRTVCIEGRDTLGGTCLNVGCIPSKILLNISHKFSEVNNDFPKFGICIKEASVNISSVMESKRKNVKSLADGIEFLFKKNKVDHIKGWGSFATRSCIEVKGKDTSRQLIQAKNIIIATGSVPSPMPGGILQADENVIITSTGALSLERVPRRMIIIGAGVIGLELGSVWLRLGSQVEVVEYANRICSTMDFDLSNTYKKYLEKQGFKFHLMSKVVDADVRNDSATLYIEPSSGGERKSLDADVVLMSVGRVPYTEGLNLKNVGIELDKAGRIIVDDEYKVPNVPSVRAIGDVIQGPMLAHKAEEEGIAVAELIADVSTGHINYDAIPSVIYTHPEFAGVGSTESHLKENNIQYKKGIFPFAANSRAKTNQYAEGMVKILADAKNDKILGAWILGPHAGELISELVVGIEYGASTEDIARTTHAHPTLSEAIKEACMAVCMKPIHSI